MILVVPTAFFTLASLKTLMVVCGVAAVCKAIHSFNVAYLDDSCAHANIDVDRCAAVASSVCIVGTCSAFNFSMNIFERSTFMICTDTIILLKHSKSSAYRDL